MHGSEFEKAVQKEASSHDLVVIGGGDGSISTAAKYLIGSSTPLGVLPLGTFNNFAKDMGIPTSLDEAIETLITGKSVTIDAGEMDGRIFVNNASIGIYTHAVIKRNFFQERFGLSKLCAMCFACLINLLKMPKINIDLYTHDKQETVQTPFIFIGNNRYESHVLQFFRRRSLSEGHLNVFYPLRMSRSVLAKMTLQAILGTLHSVPELEDKWIKELTITSRKKKIKVALDGEVNQGTPPLRFSIRSQCLNVIVPEK